MSDSPIRVMDKDDYKRWDAFVENHPEGTIYHLSAWSRIFEKTYHLNPIYIYATGKGCNEIDGVLPLVLHRSLSCKISLISLPFLDHAGVIANSNETALKLLCKAIEMAKELKAGMLEIRQVKTPSYSNNFKSRTNDSEYELFAIGEKVDMALALPRSAEKLWLSYKSKMRTKIRKPRKLGAVVKQGRIDLIEDFFTIFSTNMRDLGSPVHSKKLFENTAREFKEKFHVFVVYVDNHAIAAGICIRYKNIMYNPWASSLRMFGKMRPNWLLYWEMLQHAADSPGCDLFDFGRSSRDSGTFEFKKQWGAQEYPLWWQSLYLKPKLGPTNHNQKEKFGFAIKLWQRLPLKVATLCGPRIRKFISL